MHSTRLRNSPKTLIFAHRAVEVGADPERQLSWRKLNFQDVDYIELDVRKTLDDILVVSHHRSLKNTLRRVLVDTHTYQQLVKKTGRVLPRLDDVVEEFKGKVNFNLDLKQEGILSQLRKFIARHRLSHELLIDSFNPQELAALAESLPQADYAYSFNYHDKRGLFSFKTVRAIGYFGYFALFPLWPQLLKLIARRKSFVPAASIYYRMVNQGVVEFFSSRRIPIYVWPVNDEHSMQKLIELGIEGIKTSRPQILKNILNSRA